MGVPLEHSLHLEMKNAGVQHDCVMALLCAYAYVCARACTNERTRVCVFVCCPLALIHLLYPAHLIDKKTHVPLCRLPIYLYFTLQLLQYQWAWLATSPKAL